jgi:hypothetical protein
MISVVLMDADGAVVATGAHAHLLATSAEYRRVLADISEQHADHPEGEVVT